VIVHWFFFTFHSTFVFLLTPIKTHRPRRTTASPCTDTHTHTDRHTQTHTDTHTHRHTDTDTHRHTQTHTDTHRHTRNANSKIIFFFSRLAWTARPPAMGLSTLPASSGQELWTVPRRPTFAWCQFQPHFHDGYFKKLDRVVVEH